MLFNILINLHTNLDAAVPFQVALQTSASPIMEGVIGFHNFIMLWLFSIFILVFWLLSRCIILYQNNLKKQNFTHSTILEVLWTTLPAVLLIFIAIPSFALLYSMDEVIDPSVSLKITGNQWFWGYELSDYNYLLKNSQNLQFDSYMLSDNDLTKGSFRLLEVDQRLVLPDTTHLRFLLTSKDVLHSWAVPSLGVKLDACPGRLNQTSLFIKRNGTFYGQCSEICGMNHGFMPICLESVSTENYLKWLTIKLEDLGLQFNKQEVPTKKNVENLDTISFGAGDDKKAPFKGSDFYKFFKLYIVEASLYLKSFEHTQRGGTTEEFSLINRQYIKAINLLGNSNLHNEIEKFLLNLSIAQLQEMDKSAIIREYYDNLTSMKIRTFDDYETSTYALHQAQCLGYLNARLSSSLRDSSYILDEFARLIISELDLDNMGVSKEEMFDQIMKELDSIVVEENTDVKITKITSFLKKYNL